MKRTHVVALLCLLATVSLMVWGVRSDEVAATGPKPRYALMLAEDRGTAPLQFKQGAQTAADALRAALVTYTAEPDTPAGPQLLAMLDSIRAEKVAGIILPPCGADVLAAAQALAREQNIPLVCLWDQRAQATASVVSDREEEGRLLAEAAASGAAGRVAVFMTGTADEESMLQGAGAVLGDRLDIHRSETMAHMREGLDALAPEDGVIVLNAALVKPLADEAAGRVPVWGVDPGDTRVALLESGFAAGLVMEMPYAQGYLAVEAAFLATGFGGEPVRRTSPCRVVTRETMYLAENVKLVFPLLQ